MADVTDRPGDGKRLADRTLEPISPFVGGLHGLIRRPIRNSQTLQATDRPGQAEVAVSVEEGPR